MKTRLSAWSAAPLIIWGWSLGLILEIAPVATGGAPGELDSTFQPPPAYQRLVWSMTVVDRQLYLPNESAPGFSRLREDGSPDSSWHLQAPVTSFPLRLVADASGGWLVTDSSFVYRERADGSFSRFARIYFPASLTDGIYPQNDGSLVTHDFSGRLQRFTEDGRNVRSFPMNSKLASVAFVNPGGHSMLGNHSSRSAQDSHGRLVVVGNFQSVGGLEQPGLVRLFPDGRPDPTWNPGPALGVALTNAADQDYLAGLPEGFPIPTHFLTTFPVAVSKGTNDSVLVALEYVSPMGNPDQRMAIIREDGTVSAMFPDYAQNGTEIRIVQPDGRILIGGGYFTNWGGTPVSNLVRLNADGSLDPSFQVSLEPANAGLTSMVLDEQGRLWISGSFLAVNGTPRKGLARIFAYDPTPAAPKLEMAANRARIGTNEVLQLTATAAGHPAPTFQWYRNGEPLPGATNRGLWLPVTPETALGEFHLVAANPLGTNTLDFGSVTLGQRSPRPGVLTEVFAGPLTNVAGVTQLVPLPDGRVLFGGSYFRTEDVRPLVGRLQADGTLDSSFGDHGVVVGQGQVFNLQLLPDGGVLVAGSFTNLAGGPAYGLAEFDADGRRVPRNFPVLDVPIVTAALRLTDGRYVLTGGFSRVGDTPLFRLARLKADLTPDPTFGSPLEEWQLADALGQDSQGRLFLAGETFRSEGSLTNPVPFGLARLREDGSIDPAFQRVTGGVRELFVEPGDTVLGGALPRRWDASGQLITEFQVDRSIRTRPFDSEHRLVRLPDGRVLYPSSPGIGEDDQLTRWRADGRIDDAFGSSPETPPSRLFRTTAAAALADGSILLAVVDNPGRTWIPRVLPDSDSSLSNPRLTVDEFKADLFTQPGNSYQVRRRTTLNAGESTSVAEFTGDGYRSEVTIPGGGGTGFLELRREEP